MKIKAKENSGNMITKGKTYVVMKELINVYEIICDTGNHYWAKKSIFDVVDEEKKPMRVRAIETSDHNSITRGKIYEVTNSDENTVVIINDEGINKRMYKYRFEVVDEEKKPMRVRCIDNTLAGMLTFGKEYDVIAEDSFSYRIKRDNGKIGCFLKFRFEVVEDEVNYVDPVPTPIPEQCDLKADNPSYSSLKRVLDMAYDQASSGKGKERHANNDTF